MSSPTDLTDAEQTTPCPHCGGQLASDQRYCLQCGAPSLRARSRFLSDLSVAPPRPAAEGLVRPGAPGWSRPPLTVLLAAIAVVLIAIGLGVMIGRSGDVRTVTVPGGSTVTVDSTAPSSPHPGSAARSSTGAGSAGEGAGPAGNTGAGATGAEEKVLAEPEVVETG